MSGIARLKGGSGWSSADRRPAGAGHKRTFDNAALIVDNVISFETTDIE